jgi:hypothetical protein
MFRLILMFAFTGMLAGIGKKMYMRGRIAILVYVGVIARLLTAQQDVWQIQQTAIATLNVQEMRTDRNARGCLELQTQIIH